MDREVFRFVTVRPVQQRAGSDSGQPLIFRLDRSDSSFIASLRDHVDDRAKQLKVVRGFVASRAFIGARNKAEPRLVDWQAKLAALPDAAFSTAASELFQRIFDSNASAFVDGESYREMSRSIADSVTAAAIDSSVPARTRTLLRGLAGACAAIEALADARGFRKADFLATILVLPEGVFPVVAKGASLADKRAWQRASRERQRARELANLQQSSRTISDRHKAIDELIDAIVRRTDGRIRAAGLFLTATEQASLSAGTRSVLRDIGITGAVDVARAVSLIEERLATTDGQPAPAASTRLVRIGANILPSDVIGDLVVTTDTDATLRHPGPCAAEVMDGGGSEEGGAVTVPTGHGEARILGMADLMIVEQDLARYELSEIAHIENVLRTERRERRFCTATTTEQTVVTETETTEEKEKDLASTERFELQVESQNVISENATKEAGVTIHASYGPTVDATAKLGTTSSTATQHSDRASSTYGRETTSRAVSRLQTRTMERRTVKTVREVEEKNLHAFDNSKGTDDISGVYRFVDKIYTAQIVNYGKRLMLEFVVPEPAAFWRHALTRRPIDPVPFVNPEPPGYCLADGKTFVPLQPEDLTLENYVFWAGKYGAEDVVPPPPRTRIISVAKKGPDSFQATDTSAGAPKIGSDAFEMDIPDDYVPATAIVNVFGQTQAGDHKLVPCRSRTNKSSTSSRSTIRLQSTCRPRRPRSCRFRSTRCASTTTRCS